MSAVVIEHAKPIGLNKNERKRYSVVNLLRSQLSAAEGRKPEDSFELEVSNHIQKQLGRSGCFVPALDLAWGAKRDVLQTGIVGSGGAMVATDLMGGDFIEALRNRTILGRAGARFLSDLQGNVDFPKQNGTSNTYWVSEGATIPESSLSTDLVALRPHDVAAIVPATRRLLAQSSIDIEALVRADIVAGIAEAVDRAAISGSGAENEPLGILNYPGVGAVEIGLNGGAPNWGHLVALETAVAEANADSETSVYVMNARTRGKLKTTAKVTGQDVFLWTDTPIGTPENNGVVGTVNGYRAICSNLVPSDLSKGNGTNLSAIVFGDFSQLLLAEWGVLEILPNPYGAGYQQGITTFRAMMTCDIALRHPQAFAVITDAVTTV